MQDGIRPGIWKSRREQPRAWNLRLRQAEIKHGGRDMLGRMDLAVDVQNLLRTWNLDVINRSEAEMSVARAPTGPPRDRQPDTSHAAVKIKGKLRAPARNFRSPRRQNRFQIRVASKNGRERVFHQHGNPQVRPGLFQ